MTKTTKTKPTTQPTTQALIFPMFAAEVEAQYGLPAGILTRTLLPGGWGWAPVDDAISLKHVRARRAAYADALATLEDWTDATEEAALLRLIRYVERREAILTARVGRLHLGPRRGSQRRRPGPWLGDRIAAVYALLDPYIPAQRRRLRHGTSLTAPRPFKHTVARLTARAVQRAYGGLRWRLLYGRDLRLTVQDVKNHVSARRYPRAR